MLTLIHDSPMLPHRHDDRHRSERHLRISRITHAETRTRPRSRCIGCRLGSLPSLRSEQIIIGIVLHSGTPPYLSGITHGESRSDAEHRIGIFPSLTVFSLFWFYISNYGQSSQSMYIYIYLDPTLFLSDPCPSFHHRGHVTYIDTCSNKDSHRSIKFPMYVDIKQDLDLIAFSISFSEEFIILQNHLWCTYYKCMHTYPLI
jgi:hypothetical protein